MIDNIITSEVEAEANIIEKEYDKYIICFGSLVGMIRNKNINQSAYVIYLLDNKQLQRLILNVTGISTIQELLLHIFKRYPQLCTSKTISHHVTKYGRRLD